ncbi:MAG: CO dehydrogenase/acetyl-CoA synthase subunit delta [Halobacteriota archaeon]|nr:CO dehydrogenase/acetyl-CoA synthase subunit delta [Halobacteriota archaeon]
MTKITLEELAKLLEMYDIEELSGVSIEGDIEIELPEGGDLSGLGFVLGQGITEAAMTLLNLAKSVGYPVESLLQMPAPAAELPLIESKPAKLDSLIPAKFSVGKVKWTDQIQEVIIGATSSDGGSRGNVVKIGGEKALPFYSFEGDIPNPPAVTIDCFDIPIPLAKTVKTHYEDVMSDPGEWAKKNVEKFNADMVTIHLISTDPLISDTPAKEAAKVVEDVLQAVKVPIVIGGSGNPEKDPEVLEKAAEVAEGERCLIASANLNMDYERIANAAKKYGHVLLSWTQLDINAQKTLNRYLFKLGVGREDIIIDPTTAALGYGLDYAYTNMERIRIGGLKGDKDLSFPMSSGTTNAWGAREAWMKDSPIKEDSDWGPREYRGPLYEIVTGLTLALAGGDLFMMMHPGAVAVFKEITQTLYGAVKADPVPIEDWVSWE